MEMQFQRTVHECLQQWAEEVSTQEQTQELKLPEAMPDIGTVLGAWGQILLRSKEWRADGMNVSGGVMAWLMYAPEDGSMPRVVEGWIPFQMRWDFPQAQRDGKIITSCLLRSVDGRCLSARKLLLRAVISVAAQALEPSEYTVYSPGNVPEDIQLLRKSYPLCCPAEAGEKMFQMDEDLTLPADCADGCKLMRYELQPQIIDQKLMADKVVFRGIAAVKMLVRQGEGELKTCDFEVPFSQYAQLDREYAENACVQVIPAVTSLEMDALEEGKLRLKAGITGQYVVYDRPVVELVEDAYSPLRNVKLQAGTLEMPMVLDFRRDVVTAQQSVMDMEPVDVCFSVQQPTRQRGADGVQLSLDGTFSILGKNQNDSLQGASVKWEDSRTLPADRETKVIALCAVSGSPRTEQMADRLEMRCDVALDTMTLAAGGLPCVTGLEWGELQEPDPGRPALVLRRAGSQSLWEMAKEAGSTVEAIQKANALMGEPAQGRMLLIPVS